MSVFESFGIKEKAIQPFIRLLQAQDEVEGWNCQDNPEPYTDRVGHFINGDFTPYTVDEAEQLCYGCPLLKLCYDYAVADEITYGVWGGVDFGAEEEKND